MAKRGRPPKGEYSGKARQITTRVTPALYEAIKTAADESGVSMSQKIEHLLRLAFDREDPIRESFGDSRRYALMRVMHELVLQVEHVTGGELLEDPFTYAEAILAIGTLLEGFAPPGAANEPESISISRERAKEMGREWDGVGPQCARGWLLQLLSAGDLAALQDRRLPDGTMVHASSTMKLAAGAASELSPYLTRNEERVRAGLSGKIASMVSRIHVEPTPKGRKE